MLRQAKDPHRNLRPIATVPPSEGGQAARVDLDKIVVLVGWPLATLAMVSWHLRAEGWNGGVVAAALILGALTQIALSAGYHRYFSHRSHAASAAVEWFYLVFGAGGFQNSALKWANDHRRHHRHQDTARDPHSGRRGFWHCHVGWIIGAEKRRYRTYNVKDWEQNPRVQWQHRHYYLLWAVQTFLLPLAIGLALGAPIGGVALCGMLKALYLQHATFLINSWGHTFGVRKFAPDASATDSTLLNFLVMGEGHHNFHHAFPQSYKLTYRWFDWDPSGWWIDLLAACGQARDLKRPRRDVVRGRLAEFASRTQDRARASALVSIGNSGRSSNY